MKRLLEEQENLTLHQGMVEELIVEDDEVKGVSYTSWSNLPCKNSHCYNRYILTR